MSFASRTGSRTHSFLFSFCSFVCFFFLQRYHVRERTETIYASADLDIVSPSNCAGDIDMGKAWRTIRRSSDIVSREATKGILRVSPSFVTSERARAAVKRDPRTGERSESVRQSFRKRRAFIMMNKRYDTDTRVSIGHQGIGCPYPVTADGDDSYVE